MSTKSTSFNRRYRFRFYPTEDQKVLLAQTFGCCRFVYNHFLDKAIKDRDQYLLDLSLNSIVKRPSVSGYDFVKSLTILKQDTEHQWLNDVSAVALQQTLLDLGDAYKRFFKLKKGFPRFKKKSNHQSFTLMSNGFNIKDNKVFVAKSKDPLKIVWSRDLPSEPSSCTISKTPSGEYYISFVCERPGKLTSGTKHIGIDLGIKDFAILSDGTKILNPKYYESKQKHLKRLQQSLSRKQKESNNRNKTRLKVAKLHEHISNYRKDFLHKLSRILVNENQVIGMESLKVKNMVRNKKLSKSISSVGWSMFKDMLSYKSQESLHTVLVSVDPWYPSSHICSDCHSLLDRKLKLSERSWTCPICNKIHDRDVNAALNIKHVAELEYSVYMYENAEGIDVPRHIISSFKHTP